MTAFEVEPDDLVAHANHLDGLVDWFTTASQAADYALSDDTHGLLCAFLPPIIDPAGEQSKDALSAAVQGTKTTADNVRATASAYREADEGEAQPFLRQTAISDG
ncbi:type VII secretion target [Saccharopolyspora sp. 5N708]|uniref:type VII secretion target n=1 Tax=Saccharopolyspora sp. 5N708 TaxID=3457424 RepID=UPI003FD50E50